MRTPPPTPKSPLNNPAAVPIAASLSVRRPAMRGILGTMSPTAALAEALAPLRSDPARAAILLDIDGTLAPIVRHADDAAVPEATRAQLIAVAKRYAIVGCISGRRSTTARQMVSLGSIAYVGNHGAELLEPGSTAPQIDPEVAKHEQTVRDFAAAAYTTEVQKLRIVEYMWQVAFADGHLDANENHVISKVAGLLHVTHGEYIAAKLHAKQAAGLS